MKRKVQMKWVLGVMGMCVVLGSRILVLAGERGSLCPHQGFDFTTISEGETKFIDVCTRSSLLLGDMHVLVALIWGSGEMEITMEKSDRGGDLVLMTGCALSSSGVSTPLFKTGFTPNALSDVVEIGDGETEDGILLLVTGVLFSLGGVGEKGEYTIELTF